MTILCIAIGNPLRGDDGVARRALQLLGAHEEIQALNVLQLTPELASDIAAADRVIFLDADPSISEVVCESVAQGTARSTPLTHSVTPFELLRIARRLYNFTGEAWLCRMPAERFEYGEPLTGRAEEAARSAAKLLSEQVSALTSHRLHL